MIINLWIVGNLWVVLDKQNYRDFGQVIVKSEYLRKPLGGGPLKSNFLMFAFKH